MMVVVLMIMMMMLMLSVSNRIAELLDSRLEGSLGSFCSIILDRDGLVFKRNFESLYALLKSDVLLNLLNAVLAMEVYIECHFLNLALLLFRRLLVGKGRRLSRIDCSCNSG